MSEVKNNEIDWNIEFKDAYSKMEDSKENLLLIGRAGTGKSTLIQYFTEKTAKNVVVLAFTGVAAQNIGGQTIHSFFRFGIDITPRRVSTVYGQSKRL